MEIFNDSRQEAIDIVQNLMVPEAQHRVALALEILRAASICLAFGLPGVLAAVELDHQAGFGTEEVGDVGADLVLASELGALELPVAQPLP